jgi:hypothetical protein
MMGPPRQMCAAESADAEEVGVRLTEQAIKAANMARRGNFIIKLSN